MRVLPRPFAVAGATTLILGCSVVTAVPAFSVGETRASKVVWTSPVLMAGGVGCLVLAVVIGLLLRSRRRGGQPAALSAQEKAQRYPVMGYAPATYQKGFIAQPPLEFRVHQRG
jgi:hypothetical protein